jgi:deglycase
MCAKTKRKQTMTAQRPKIAALIADAFQEEEYFFPKVALNEAGYQVDVVSSHKEPVKIYSYFARTGLLDVDRAIADARPEDYVGVLVPGGAKSPALLAEDDRVTRFVQDVSARGGVIACICRGSMLAARSKVVAGRRMTGFNDSASYPELVVQPDAEAAGATWVQDAPTERVRRELGQATPEGVRYTPGLYRVIRREGLLCVSPSGRYVRVGLGGVS